MTLPIALKAAAVWVAIVGLAFSSAAMREFVLIPKLGQTRGLALSGLTLATLVFLAAWASLPWMGARRPQALLAIGLGWLVLTIAFDLALGWVQHKPAQQVLDAYLFRDGNLWPLVLAVTALAPCLAAKLRGWW